MVPVMTVRALGLSCGGLLRFEVLLQFRERVLGS
jgi:hypothetical protein